MVALYQDFYGMLQTNTGTYKQKKNTFPDQKKRASEWVQHIFYTYIAFCVKAYTQLAI